jgi:hypothetical protein
MKCFEILQIAPTKNKKEIKKAFAMQSKLLHPEEQKEAFLSLQQAYQQALQYAQDEEIEEVVDEQWIESPSQAYTYPRDSFFKEAEVIDEHQAALTYVQQQLSVLPAKLTCDMLLELFQNEMFLQQLSYPEASEEVDETIYGKKWKLKKKEALQLEQKVKKYELPLIQQKLTKITKKNQSVDMIKILFSSLFVIGMNIFFILDEEEPKPLTYQPSQLILDEFYDGIQIKEETIYDQNNNIITSDYEDLSLGLEAILYQEDDRYIIYETKTKQKFDLGKVRKARFITTSDDSQYYVTYLKESSWYFISKQNQEPTMIENDYDVNTKIVGRDGKFYFEEKEDE